MQRSSVHVNDICVETAEAKPPEMGLTAFAEHLSSLALQLQTRQEELQERLEEQPRQLLQLALQRQAALERASGKLGLMRDTLLNMQRRAGELGREIDAGS